MSPLQAAGRHFLSRARPPCERDAQDKARRLGVVHRGNMAGDYRHAHRRRHLPHIGLHEEIGANGNTDDDNPIRRHDADLVCRQALQFLRSKRVAGGGESNVFLGESAMSTATRSFRKAANSVMAAGVIALGAMPISSTHYEQQCTAANSMTRFPRKCQRLAVGNQVSTKLNMTERKTGAHCHGKYCAVLGESPSPQVSSPTQRSTRTPCR